MLALLDHLGIDQAVLGGMSQGGFLSLRAALLAPERVRALVLIDSQAGLEDPAAAPAYEEMERIWLEQGPAPVQDVVASIILGPPDGPVDYAPWFAKWAELDPQEHELRVPLPDGPRRHHRPARRDQLPGADHSRHRRRGDPDGAGRGGACRAGRPGDARARSTAVRTPRTSATRTRSMWRCWSSWGRC